MWTLTNKNPVRFYTNVTVRFSPHELIDLWRERDFNYAAAERAREKVSKSLPFGYRFEEAFVMNLRRTHEFDGLEVDCHVRIVEKPRGKR